MQGISTPYIIEETGHPDNPRTPAMPRCSRYASLDLWRGVACLLVVAYHSTMVYSAGDGSFRGPAGFLVWLTRFMMIGVPLFFVISGYCIAAAADASRRRPRPVGSYFARRIRRIYPPFWIVVAISALFIGSIDLAVPGLLSGEPVPMLRPWWFSGWQWLGNLTLTETWRHHVIGGPRGHFPGHSWTLCYEEQFYAVMGLILVVAPQRLFTAATIVTVSTIAVGLLANAFEFKINGFFFDGFWVLFAAGILVYAKINYSSGIRARLCDLVLLAGLIYACLGPTPLVLPYAEDRVGVVAAFLFALVISIAHRWDARLAALQLARPLMFCGTICYSLYLIHPPIVRSISKTFHLLGFRDAMTTLAFTVPTCVAASVAAGWVFHVAVERRFLNSVRSGSEKSIMKEPQITSDACSGALALPSPAIQAQ